MKISLLTVLLILLFSCSHTEEKRTRFSDKNMRIMIDPASLSAENYVRLQTSLTKSQVWTVLDRKAGMEAIKKEQEQLHKTEADRYENREKFAKWGKLYGVGAVVVGHVQCFKKEQLFSFKTVDYWCDQFINLIDANTGEVIVAVEGGEYSEDSQVSPNWDKTVEKLIAAYPKDFKSQPISEKLEIYKKESEEEAKRVNEK